MVLMQHVTLCLGMLGQGRPFIMNGLAATLPMEKDMHSIFYTADHMQGWIHMDVLHHAIT